MTLCKMKNGAQCCCQPDEGIACLYDPAHQVSPEELNHEEALQLAHLHKHKSNLARCYIDLAATASGAKVAPVVRYGCHCDLASYDDLEPDGCVIDDGRPEDCVNAAKYTRKEDCHEWKPIIFSATKVKAMPDWEE